MEENISFKIYHVEESLPYLIIRQKFSSHINLSIVINNLCQRQQIVILFFDVQLSLNAPYLNEILDVHQSVYCYDLSAMILFFQELFLRSSNNIDKCLICNLINV